MTKRKQKAPRIRNVRPSVSDRQIREMIVEDFQKCLRALVGVSYFPTELELIRERETDRIKSIMRDVIADIK